ncbi:hypothetical protein VD659_13260 [Herbiconiux sp. 11R-BC]|uniref:hypothetical protein n=1 Tax=Herbiconiux sp. 11R-BC TaxID=3111637 RepID=UPI003C051B41
MESEPRRDGADQSEPRYGIRTTGAGAAAPGSVYAGAMGVTGETAPAFTEPEYEPEPAGTSLGTRVLGLAAAFLVGGVFGILGTIVHQISVSVFGLFDLPVGLILALAAEGMLLVGLRMVAPTRLAAVLAAVALVGLVALLALPSPGGSVLIPDSVAGMVWLVGSTLLAVAVLAWPRLAGAHSGGKSRAEHVDLNSR